MCPALQERKRAIFLRLHSLKSSEIGGDKAAMTDEQGDDHQADQSCREASDTPQDVDARFESREEHAITD